MTSPRRTALVLTTATALVLPTTAGAIPPGGARTNERGAKVTIVTRSVRAGGAVRVRGSRMPQRSGSVTIKLDDSAILQVLRISSRGTFSGSVRIPSSVRRGTHGLRFLAPSPATSVRRTFRVR